MMNKFRSKTLRFIVYLVFICFSLVIQRSHTLAKEPAIDPFSDQKAETEPELRTQPWPDEKNNEEILPENPPRSTFRKRKSRTPLYQSILPSWGMQLSVSPRTLGSTSSDSNTADPAETLNPAVSLAVQFEYQPFFLQSFGVMGFGPSFEAFPFSAKEPSVSRTPGTYALGAQIRYQARYLHEQIIVPNVGYSLQSLSYKLSTEDSGRLNLQGPFFGIWVLLNSLEPSAAAEIFVVHGVTRSYFVAELRLIQGEDENVVFSSRSFFFGLRVEL